LAYRMNLASFAEIENRTMTTTDSGHPPQDALRDSSPIP
jgi:hypothetical protein